MGFFKKLGRGIRKVAGKKLLKKALRIGAGFVTGGQSEVAIRAVGKLKSTAKTLGIGARKGRRSKSEAAQLAKMAAMRPPGLATTASAETMPGGAPLVRSARRGVGGRVRATVARAKAAPRVKTPRKAAGGRRGPPKGGKDLKALSVSWRAAGKPGRWIDWVKTH